MKEENKIILYQDDNEITRVSVRFADEDLWLTQNQLAEIYQTTQQNIALLYGKVYSVIVYGNIICKNLLFEL